MRFVMTVLSVNVNKVAVLRNSRGGGEPSVVAAAEAVIAAGAGGITVHPRPDQRHIRPDDVTALAQCIRGQVEYNLEGNPFAPPRAGYPGFLALVAAVSPTQATLVPDNDDQLTSDHGFDLRRDGGRLRPLIAELRAIGARVSLFMDAGCDDIELAAEVGAQRVELYTGPYAHAFAQGDAGAKLARCAETARRAQAVGLSVNAGHDLSQANLGAFLRGVANVREVSIGHALFGEALHAGLAATVRAYLDIIDGVAGQSAAR
jgi:pyridoxine 5-phosphate synthase